MQNYILYRTENSIHSINECRYSLLKLLALYNLQAPKNLGIVIHTKHPESFDAFTSFFSEIEFVAEAPQEKFKIELIQDFFATRQGNLLYMDNDTYLLQAPDELFENISNSANIIFFQKKQGPKKLKDFISASHIMLDGREINFLDETELYTAEVLGCNNDAIAMIHNAVDLYNQVKDGVSLMMAEAFAFTYASKEYKRQTSEKQIVSYRKFPEFKNLLQVFFKKNEEESIPNLVKMVHHLDAVAIEKDKATYEQLPFFKKLLHSVTGKAWSLRRYQNKF